MSSHLLLLLRCKLDAVNAVYIIIIICICVTVVGGSCCAVRVIILLLRCGIRCLVMPGLVGEEIGHELVHIFVVRRRRWHITRRALRAEIRPRAGTIRAEIRL